MIPKGFKHSKETKQKMSESQKKRPYNPNLTFKGRKHTQETKERIREYNVGHKHSEETRRKISKIHKGKVLSKEHKEKLSKVHKKNPIRYWLGKTGANHHSWRGGISFEPYSIDWTETLKKSIRQRDKYTCQICGKEPAIVVHHIDYDKKNCDPKNLITLCRGCHSKTNYKRKYWTNYFNNKLINK